MRALQWVRTGLAISVAAALSLSGLVALAAGTEGTYQIKDGNGVLQSVVDFTSCYSGATICPTFIWIDSSGNEKGIPTNPLIFGGVTKEVCISPTVTASAYAAGNLMGGLISLPSAVFGLNTGVLESIRLDFKSVQTAEFDVYFFASQPAGTYTDKATPSISGADSLLVQPPLKLVNNASGLGTHTVYGLDGIGRAINLGAGTLYAVVQTEGTPTPASTSDMQLCASVLQD